MQPPEANQNLRCDNIVLTPRGIAETCGKKVVIFVPAAEIERLTLKYGRSDHRPIFSLSVGVLFALIGVLGLIELIIATSGFRYEVGMVALGIIGGSLIYDALKQRYFLEVHSPKGTRKLVLSKHVQKSDIQNFCHSVRTNYKYDLTETA
jgi:hypothetical protein